MGREKRARGLQRIEESEAKVSLSLSPTPLPHLRFSLVSASLARGEEGADDGTLGFAAARAAPAPAPRPPCQAAPAELRAARIEHRAGSPRRRRRRHVVAQPRARLPHPPVPRRGEVQGDCAQVRRRPPPPLPPASSGGYLRVLGWWVVTCACSSAALGDLICHAARLVFRFSLRDEFGGFLGLFLFWFWTSMVAAKKRVSLQLGSICCAR